METIEIGSFKFVRDRTLSVRAASLDEHRLRRIMCHYRAVIMKLRQYRDVLESPTCGADIQELAATAVRLAQLLGRNPAEDISRGHEII